MRNLQFVVIFILFIAASELLRFMMTEQDRCYNSDTIIEPQNTNKEILEPITFVESPTPSLKPSTDQKDTLTSGLIYFFHVPKTGGYEFIFKMNQMRERAIVHDWDPQGKTEEQLQKIVQNAFEKKYDGKVHVVQHHHRYPSFVDTLEWLLFEKKRAEDAGFVFEIIMTLRDLPGFMLSAYNYKHYWKKGPPESYPEFIADNGNYQLDYMLQESIHWDSYTHNGKAPMPEGIPFHGPYFPWDERNVGVENYFPAQFLGETQTLLQNIDFIFFTGNIDRLYDWVELKYGLNLKHLKKPVVNSKILLPSQVNMKEISAIFQRNALEQMFLDQARAIGEQKFWNFIKQFIALEHTK